MTEVLRRKVRQILKRPGARYVLVGGSVYCFEMAVIVAAQQLGAKPVAAVAISYWLGFLVSFGFQKIVTFGDKRLHHRVVLPQFLAMGALVLFNFCFTLLVTRLLAGVLPTVVSRTLAIGMTTMWNFYLYHTRIFKDTAAEPEIESITY